jgi:uroporphyrinogen decarboxylase
LKPILDVLEGREPDRRPMWIMRQAGRYLPEYRDLRAKAGSFLKLCYDPALACEVTLQPLRRFDFDAAILFSDILVVPHAMGLHLDFKEGEGPVLETVKDVAEVEALGDGRNSDQFSKVYETVQRVKGALTAKQTLIGFCGAPWTVASYMIEGGSSKREKALGIALENPVWFSRLIDRLVETSTAYLLGQIKAGAETVQIFDSWAGDVPEGALERLVISPIARIIEGIRVVHPGFPVIVFARGVGQGHAKIAVGTGANCVGLEEDVVIGDVLKTLPWHVAVQGNLGNEMLLGDEAAMLAQTRRILDSVPAQRHIFNLGHGIQQQTSIAMVEKLVAEVRARG